MKKKFEIITVFGVFLLVQSLSALTWAPTKRLTWTSGGSFSQAIAVDSNDNIHIVWADYNPGNFEVFYMKSTDEGATWTSSRRLTWNSGSALDPEIALDSGNNIHVFWADDTPGNYEIYYKKSTNGGVTWVTRRLTWNAGLSYSPVISLDSSSQIHLIWVDETPGNQEIFYKNSTNGGLDWTAKRLTWNSGDSEEPAIAVDSNKHIHVVFYDDTPGNAEIFHIKSTDGGNSWSTNRMTYTSGDSRFPSIVIDQMDNIHVICTDMPGGEFVYYKKSTNGGTSWITKRLAWNYFSTAPAITVDSNDNIHVTYSAAVSGNYDVYHKRSTDGGATWTTKRLTWNSGWSFFPDITAAYNNHIHLVWYDDSPGNNEIFYRKGIQ